MGYLPQVVPGDQKVTIETQSGVEGYGTESTYVLPQTLYEYDKDSGPPPDPATRSDAGAVGDYHDVNPADVEDSALVTLAPRTFSDWPIKVKATYHFDSFSEPWRPVGTNCRGRIVVTNLTTDATQVFYTSTTNSSGASITSTISIPRTAFEPNTLYHLTWEADVYGGSYPTGLPLTDHRGQNYLGWFYLWADRTPLEPTITAPPNGSAVVWGEIDPQDSIFDLEWTNSDPDGGAAGGDHGGYEVQFRPAPSVDDPNPAWIVSPESGTPGSGDANYSSRFLRRLVGGPDGPLALALQSDHARFYAGPPADRPDGGTALTYGIVQLPSPGLWQFRARIFDYNARVPGIADAPFHPTPSQTYAISPWSNSSYISVVAAFLPPTLIAPVNGVAQEVGQVEFQWLFRDPRITGGTQAERQVRIRLAGGDETDWVELIPPGSVASASETYLWTNGDGFTIQPGFRYEWQANTVATPGSVDAEWTSEIGSFWGIPAPGSGSVIPVPDLTIPDPGLGCGDNRVFVYSRGGTTRLGEITGMVQVKWARQRDAITEATVTVRDWSDDCGELLAMLRSWQMELVIFRDNGQGPVRVWEGPITLLTYEVDQVTIGAHDCMAYVYRRILRIGFNDAYRASGGGLTPVTLRSQWIIQNALSYDDPNLLAYMQVIYQPDDARNSRVVNAFDVTAWQQVDDFAAKSGLDYVTVGRKIILFDTHTPIGRLPEMRDGDFGTPPIVTEYGMQLANFYAVTNNAGVYGTADRFDVNGDPEFYGYIEMLSSAYGESDQAAASEVLTAEQRARLEETLAEQAERNISGRYPAPLVVRVPDNSTLNPEINVGINQLIPGVHIPLRAADTLRQVTQMQKLDRVEVTQTDKVEQVQITLSPAPKSREEDPDVEEEVP